MDSIAAAPKTQGLWSAGWLQLRLLAPDDNIIFALRLVVGMNVKRYSSWMDDGVDDDDDMDQDSGYETRSDR